MVRTMLKPRWLGSLVVLLALLVAFVFLGLWQLDVARDAARTEAIRQAADRPLAPLSQVVQPHQPFPDDGSLRRVEATGRYDTAAQVVVVDRRLDGATGSWVVTPLLVTDTGARLAVVRGFVRGETAPPPAVVGQVRVVGSLAPAESPTEPRRALQPGQLPSIDLAHLVNVWDGPLYNAFVFAVEETPDATAAGPRGSSSSGSIERVPPPELPSGLTLRNAAYALQWWLFGAFFAWLWWRMLRDDHRRSRHPEPAPAPAESPLSTVGDSRL